ncbi:hypothetical protein GmRootA79_09830 [Acidovorax sp. A79]
MKTVHTRLDHLWVQLQRRKAVGLMAVSEGRGAVPARAPGPRAASTGDAAVEMPPRWQKQGRMKSSQATRKRRRGGGCWLQPAAGRGLWLADT